jgi:hypothetical protein
MKRLLVLGVLVFGITALGLAQNQGGNGNGNCDGNGNGCPVQMPEGPAFELPLFIVGAASWGLWRRHSRTRKNVNPARYNAPWLRGHHTVQFLPQADVS